ncbi:hypothetical protein J2Z79_000874 [Symbiobacterium terraclitae]|uniref:Uncharacterized protein n=1 Tax=Symbiobacterium terraclitae TaxID=557451 RepID=A0ABS4JRG7_9FIRM|nr:hypothetical protein [Symbiobacterium terraclitae]
MRCAPTSRWSAPLVIPLLAPRASLDPRDWWDGPRAGLPKIAKRACKIAFVSESDACAEPGLWPGRPTWRD